MADPRLPEDEAILYVLGELPTDRRKEFEARMTESVELRNLVRELEEGAVALSTASPQRRPPAQAWANIEQAVRRDSNQRKISPAFWINWWRNGWAVATASLAGWLLYAIFIGGHRAPQIATPQVELPHETAIAQADATIPKPPLPVASNANSQLLRVRTEEIGDLRLKLAQLEKETGQLSQLIVQQRAQLSETNRIKFYQLSSAPTIGSDAVTPQLSPALQRAIYMSIGRELGWLPSESKPRISPAGHAIPETIGGVDFVDLRPPNNTAANQSPTPQTPSQPGSVQPAPAQPQTEAQSGDLPAPTIPAYVSGDKVIVALDPSVVAANSSVTFSVNGLSLGAGEMGFIMGNNPAVVTIPFSAGSSYGGGLFLVIGTTTPSGQSNITQFLAPTTP